MKKVAIVLWLVVLASPLACIQLSKGLSSSGGSTVSAGCTKIKAYCKADGGSEGTCSPNENPACSTDFEAEVDCLISNRATCNAAGELQDDLPACATQHAATANCAARNVDAGGDGSVPFPAICKRLKAYCNTTEAKDADCLVSYNTAGRCLSQFEAAFNCFMDNRAGCSAAGEVDETVPACQTKLAAYVNCAP